MSDFNKLARDFLAQKRIAVVGVSRDTGTANGIYRKLRDEGYTVFAVNPNTDEAEGDPCYPSIKELPGPVDGAVIVTKPAISEQVMHDCVEAGVPRVWMHYNPMFGADNTSVSDPAVTYGREHGVTVIAGGCPMMFLEVFHKVMKWFLGVSGKLPA
jgi:predicted CoA-binding protein